MKKFWKGVAIAFSFGAGLVGAGALLIYIVGKCQGLEFIEMFNQVFHIASKNLPL